MEKTSDKSYIENKIQNSPMTILYFSGNKCGACEVIKEKVEIILKAFPKINGIEVNGEENLELAASYDVFSLPLLILYIEGKESIRVGRNINLNDFENQIERYYNLIY